MSGVRRRRMTPALRVGVALAVAAGLVFGVAALAAAHRPGARTPGSIYVIGDSWSAGLYADSEHTLAQDAADDVGMTSTVDAESGTGYLKAPAGTRSYQQRAAAIPVGTRADVVILQGGSNDDGSDAERLATAIRRTIAEVRTAAPDASVVLLGPGPDPWPVTAEQRAVDTILDRAAVQAEVAYVSPMREGWFTAKNIDEIIDPVNDHPTVSGDEVLGVHLAAALRPVLDARDARTRSTPGAAPSR